MRQEFDECWDVGDDLVGSRVAWELQYCFAEPSLVAVAVAAAAAATTIEQLLVDLDLDEWDPCEVRQARVECLGFGLAATGAPNSVCAGRQSEKWVIWKDYGFGDGHESYYLFYCRW